MCIRDRETPVWCMIYDSLDYQNEADIFANQMKHVRPLKPYEIFMANIEAGNEQQLVIKRLVESYSLSIGPTKAYGVICAVATLELSLIHIFASKLQNHAHFCICSCRFRISS